MMCWESLDDSEPTSKKRKTHSQDEATNDKADKMDDKMHTKHTTMTEFRQPLQVQSHLEMPGILVQLGHIQRT